MPPQIGGLTRQVRRGRIWGSPSLCRVGGRQIRLEQRWEVMSVNRIRCDDVSAVLSRVQKINDPRGDWVLRASSSKPLGYQSASIVSRSNPPRCHLDDAVGKELHAAGERFGEPPVPASRLGEVGREVGYA